MALIFSHHLAADDVLIRECVESAKRYGNGQGDDYISKDCFDWAKKSKSAEMIYVQPKKCEVMGFENMVFISEFKEGKYLTHLLAGQSTGLTRIKALSVNPNEREVYILQDNELLVFSMNITGNVGPMRKWRSALVQKTKSIDYLPESDELVLKSEQGEKRLPRLIQTK